MRKFKIISTCVALLLMVALMAFGVYAASVVTVSVSGTITFKCTDVYIDVTYGLLAGETNTANGPYSSQAGDSITWKDSFDKVVTLPALPNLAFSEEITTCKYYVTVQNMHGMAIYFNFGYNWINEKENNIINAGAVVLSGSDVANLTSPTTLTFNDNGIVGEHQVEANAVETLVITLTLSNTERVANGKICIVMAASVNSGGAEIKATDLAIS